MNQRHGDISESKPAAGLGLRGRIALAGFAAIAAYFLWTEHRAHVIQLLPWAFLALCPLMHLFMHGGHGGHGAHPPDYGAGRSPR
jgi:hypothetical protein